MAGPAIGVALTGAAAAGARGQADAASAPSALALDERPAGFGPASRQEPRSQQPFTGHRGGAPEDGFAAGPGPGTPQRKRVPPWLGAAAILSLVGLLLVAIALAGHPKPRGQPGAAGSSAPARPAARSHQSGQAGSQARGGQAPQAATGSGTTGGASGAGQAPSAPATSQPASGAGPVTVVIAYFTAINNREWNLVWTLGGKNLYSSYVTMVADLTGITQDYVTIVSTAGENVVTRVRTVTVAGLTLIHVYSYVVQGGTIISGVLEPGS